MFSDRIFAISLVASFLLHGVIMLQNPNFSPFETKKREGKLEVSYIKEKKPQPKTAKALANRIEPFLKLDSPITLNKKPPPPFVDKQTGPIQKAPKFILPESAFNKPAFIKPDVIAIKKKITLPPVDMNKIDNPSYIGYYQIVREKIRRSAYQNYANTETGEVFMAFVISREGALKDVRIVDEKSSPHKYLRQIAIKSVKDASPFPNFPKELDYPQLSFNGIISFEIE